MAAHKSYKPWTDQEAKLLRENYRKPIPELVKKFGRSWVSIRPKGRSIGLHRSYISDYKHELDSLKETDCAWLAGIIDGEGDLGLGRIKQKGNVSLRPSIRVSNTSKVLIDKINSYIPMSISTKKWEGNRKDIYIWHLYGVESIYLLLKMVYPYLSCKKPQATLLMEFCKSRMNRSAREKNTSREFAIQEELHLLNKRGRFIQEEMGGG